MDRHTNRSETSSGRKLLEGCLGELEFTDPSQELWVSNIRNRKIFADNRNEVLPLLPAEVRARGELVHSSQSRRKLFHDNAAQVYGIEAAT